MAKTKLSGIASGGAYNSVTDLAVVVRSGTADYLAKIPASVGYFNVLDYGAKGDGKTLSDVTTTASSAVISSASYSFTSADVGKYITIAGAGASASVLNATINSVSSGAATLSASAGTAISGTGVATFGTDNAGAITAAVNAASAAGGGTVRLPNGMFVVASKIVWQSKVSLVGNGASVSILKWIGLGDMGYGEEGVIVAIGNDVTTPYVDCRLEDFEIDCLAATMATYVYLGKCIIMTYALRPVFRNLYLHDSPATGLGVDFIRDGIITGNRITNAGRLNDGTGHGGAGISWETGQAGGQVEFTVVSNNIIVNACRFGIANEETDPLSTNAQRSIITGNIVRATNTTGSGIQDNGMLGAIITDNVVTCTNGTNQGYGISAGGGTVPYDTGTQGIIANNYVTGWQSGIVLDGVGAISPNGYSVRGNTVYATLKYGILVQNLSTNVTDAVNVTDNYVSACASAGIAVVASSGTPTFKNLTISGNTCANNATVTGTDSHKAGIWLDGTVTGLNMQDNFCFDDSPSTQKYGISFDSGFTVSNAKISGNHVKNNTTQGFNILGTISGWLSENLGYNPIGASSVTPGGSPWTYTAGNTPETIYLYGGTVSSVAKNSITLATALSSTTSLPVSLQPGEAVTVTYSSAPTVVRDQH